MSENEPPAQPNTSHVGRTSTRQETDQPAYWDAIYEESEENSPGWNLGQPNAEFVWQLAHATPPIKPGRLLVPGCGFGHDAAFFAAQGFDVLAADISEWAIAGARKTFAEKGVQVETRHGDIFHLPKSLDGTFDYIVEHTFFCAIHPERRGDYRDLAHRLLKPGGQLLGLFYFHQKIGGPPFNTTPEDVRATFAEGFRIETLALAENNIEKRRGRELWARIWKQGA